MYFNSDNTEIQKRMNEKSNSLAIEKTDLQEELKKLKLTKIITHTKEELIEILSQYLDGDINDINYQRKIINKFINSIYLYDDKVIIYYNVINNNNKITFEESQKIQNDNSVLISRTMDCQ